MQMQSDLIEQNVCLNVENVILNKLITLFCCIMFRNSSMNLIMFIELHTYNLKVNEINIF